MNYRDSIPPDMLKRFDRIGVVTVGSKLKLGEYHGKEKKYATMYVDHHESDREDKIFRISKRKLIITAIATVLAAIAIIIQIFS